MEIKITEEMYDKAVMKAMHKFDNAGKKDMDEEKSMVNMMMGLQNALFASMLREELFNIKEDK